MPLYDYKCMRCEQLTERLVRTEPVLDLVPCEQCGYAAKRIISAGAGRQSGESRSIWSRSFGINPDQIPEMTRRFPGDEYHPVTGAMKINGFQHQKQIAKRLGMVID